MGLNIIIKKGKSKISREELSEHITQQNEKAAVREKHEYKEKSRQLRKAADNLPKQIGDFRLESVMDARTYFRHAQDPNREGAMQDDSYRRELLRDNPEIDCR
ncbi:hypothetical protein OAK38_06165 [Verrucomicrobia bacterium]|nr:hypothetical protein [Verrucomicrobiota bacterium]